MNLEEKKKLYAEMLAAFDEGHRKLKHLKKEIAKLQSEIAGKNTSNENGKNI